MCEWRCEILKGNRKDESETSRYPIILPVQLKEDLEYIAKKEGHATLSSFIRSELVSLRNKKMKQLKKDGDYHV